MELDLLKCGAAGAAAGLVCDTLLYPLDLARANLNAPRPPTAPPLPAHPLRALAAIFRELPARRLFRGYACVPYFAPTAYALYFGAYEYWSRTAESELLAGFSAEATANPIYIPYDIMKQRFMVGREAEGASVPAAVRGVLERDGLRGMYRGFLLTFATYGPFSAIYFHAYAAFTKWGGDAPLAWGSLSGAVAGTATQPVDWLKTRVQVASETRLSLPKVVADAVRHEGAGTMFRGSAARAFWLGASCGITMHVYEAGKRALGAFS